MSDNNGIFTFTLELSNSFEVSNRDESSMKSFFNGEWELLQIIQIPEANKLIFNFRRLNNE